MSIVYLYLHNKVELIFDDDTYAIPNDKNLKHLVIYGCDTKIPFIIRGKNAIPDNIEQITIFSGENVSFCVGNICVLGKNIKKIMFNDDDDLIDNLKEMYLWPEHIILETYKTTISTRQQRNGDDRHFTDIRIDILNDSGIIKKIHLLYSNLPLPIYDEVIDNFDIFL